MALAQISMIGPRAEQQKQEKPKKEAIDYILEGLQVAQGITGIAVNYQTIKSKMGENAVAEDKRQGILPVTEQADMAKEFDRVPANAEGSTLMKYRRGDEVEEVSWLPRKKEVGLKPPSTRLITTVGADGKPTQQIVEDKVGFSAPAYVKPDKQGKPDEFSQTELSKMAITEGNTLMRETRGYNSIIKSADEASTLIEKAKTNPVATAPALRKLARASGEVGVLTDSDVEAFGGSQAVFARLERAAESAANGTLPEADAAFAKEIAELMRAKAIANREDMINEAVDRFSVNAKIPREDAYQKLTGKKLGAQNTGGQQMNKPTYRPGTILDINGKRYRVEQDGDTLTEIPAVSGK